jgi:hypothetical protein
MWRRRWSDHFQDEVQQMTISLGEGRSAALLVIRRIEAEIGCPLSDQVKGFLARYDGAKPEPNVFEVPGGNKSGVSQFIPAVEVLKVRKSIEDISRGSYPIARDDCDNLILVDEEKNGAISFWDHERTDPPVRLADNLECFLSSLKVFDKRSVKLKPGQVKSVWISPGFL